ncbi:MAG: Integral membrane protein (intg_mem_TP0381) [Planctomycetes bacterium ADurb.Bin126]|nr:MAG: Integral membrane protein (intg_mem_TP0381) [Planctomycetes bacterium ADurb.Bin126]
MGPSHQWALWTVAAACLLLPLGLRRMGRPRLTRAAGWVLAGVLVVNEIMYWVYMLGQVDLTHFLQNSLPLHVCGIAIFLIAWEMIRHNQLVYELTYYWGLGGTLQAVLTPNLIVDAPHYLYYQYFIAHGGILVGVLLATLAMGRRPGRGSVLRAFVASNVLMVAIGLADLALGANYMFLCERPAGASPFFFLPWPWYLIFLEFFGLALMGVLYLPFCLRKKTAAPAPLP